MAAQSSYADWIAVDWGTSHLRVWIMEGNRAKAALSSDQGMGKLDRAGFEPALLDLIAPYLGNSRVQVIACGMVGSRQGWVEAAYTAVPAQPLSGKLARPVVKDARLDVRVVPGLKQTSPADVMRGEETQIAGFLAAQPRFDGVICLPGTHTKWAQVSAGEVVSFRTFMTGELFSALSKQTVLRHSIGDGWDDDEFLTAVSDAIAKPEQIAARMFSLRAEALLNDLDPAAARARLSGFLIGSELSASRPYWLGQSVAIIAADDLAEVYAKALRQQGVDPRLTDGTALTCAGLATAHDMIKETVG